jgi:PAS domain S-box-containing protein
MGEYDQLRRQAEEKIPARINITEAITPEEAQRIIHELQVHQIELELQNEDMRKTQRQMEESRARYADLYDFAPVGYLTLDRYDIIQEANLTMATQLGVDRGRLINSPLHLYMDSQDRERWRSHCNQVFAEPGRQTFEVRLRRRDGGQFDAWLESIAVEDILGHQLMRTAITDITARRQAEEELKKHRHHLERLVEERTAELVRANEQLKGEIDERQEAEEALRESEERFRLLVDHGFDGIFIHENFRIVDMNNQLIDITGYSSSELFGLPPINLFTPDSQQRIHDYIISGKQGYYELELRKKDGRILQIESFGAPCRFHGREARIVALRNITERKEAEEALRVSENEFSKLYEGMRDCFVVVDMDGKIINYNRAYQELIGFDDDEIPQLTNIDITPEEWREFEENIVKDQVLRRGYSDVYEKEYRRKDDTIIPIELRTILIQDENNQPKAMWAMIRDITDRKQAVEAIETSLREKEILLREIYHRTKNNLQVVCSLLNLQSARFSDPHLLGAFEDTGNRIRSMALLQEKLYQSKDLSHLDLKDYVKDIVNNLLINFQTGYGKISLHLDLQSVIVNIDTAMPCGLLINELVSNALKYAFPGGRHGTISIFLSSTEDSGIELRVADDGVGLPPELDVWNTDSLGLKLVLNLAQNQLQGKLAVRRDQGTEFRLLFRELDYQARI